MRKQKTKPTPRSRTKQQAKPFRFPSARREQLRKQTIKFILDSQYNFTKNEKFRREHPDHWSQPGTGIIRAIHGQAKTDKARLTRLSDAKLFAECQSQYRNNETIESIKQSEFPKIDAREKVDEEDRIRGEKIKRGGKRGHEKTHGDTNAKNDRWKQYQTEADLYKARNPKHSKEAIYKHVMSKFRVSTKTLQRRIKI